MFRPITMMISMFCVAPLQGIASPPSATPKKELLAVDQAAAAVAATGDVDRILNIWADDAIVSFPGRPQAIGKQAIQKMVRANRSRPGFEITWTPTDAHVAHSNELGYTYGDVSHEDSGSRR